MLPFMVGSCYVSKGFPCLFLIGEPLRFSIVMAALLLPTDLLAKKRQFSARRYIMELHRTWSTHLGIALPTLSE